MAAGGVEDINSVVECLVNMFAGVINKDAIISVVESCGGDLNLSVDAVMKITNDIGSVMQEDVDNTRQNAPSNTQLIDKPSSSNVQQLPAATSQNQSPPNSFSMMVQKCSQAQQPTSSANQNLGAVPKARHTSLGYHGIQWTDQIRRIVENHNKDSRILILMRGVPGSGKTFLAKSIIELLVGGTYVNYHTHICSTDDYFMYNGRYHFNKHHLSDAHTWNQKRVINALKLGLSPIVIDNTNIEIWEMEIYVRNGVLNGYFIEVIEPNTAWAKKANQCAKRNVHDVPIATLRRMLENYTPNITGESLLRHFKLRYPPNKNPPVLRSISNSNTQDSDKNTVTNTQPNSSFTTTSNIVDQNIAGSADNHYIEQQMANTVLLSHPSETNINESDNHDAELDITLVEPEISQQPIEMAIDDNVTEPHEEENTSNQYVELQKQLEEIEKVEREWENGESWEEGRQVATTSTDDCEKPRPQRSTSPKSHRNTDENLMDAVNNCQDWNQISLFMPPWKDDTLHSTEHVEKIVETISSGTCMELGDFDSKNTYKIITTTPRNINEFHISFQREKIPEKRMFDKSTTTNELTLTETTKRCKNEESHFIALRKMFKNVSKSALRDIFDQCMGDVNWAVEIVLDGMASKQFDIVDEDDVGDEDDNNELCTCLSSYNIVPDSSPKIEVVSEPEKTIVATNDTTVAVIKKTSKREIKQSDSVIQLKRQIEQNVVIAERHYSEHLLRWRKSRYGESSTEGEVVEQVQDINQPSTSTGAESNDQIVVRANQSDDDSSDDELSNMGSEEPEKTVNISLGLEFIAELDALFGRIGMYYPQPLNQKINMPLSLLNEINALWMESLMNQFDEQERQRAKMILEDEDFAKALAMKEAELAVVGKPPEVLDFKEIMDMDLAISLYQRDVAGWKNKEPNDLAAKLTRDKLYHLFPEVDKEVLAELLVAHDNNFQSTVEVLLVSTGKADLLKDKNGLNNFVTKKEMERQQKVLEEERKALSEVEWPLLPKGEVPDMQVVNSYRDNADRHLENRNKNIIKASEYVNRGLINVGSYYRQLAEFHKLKYEQSNSLAAASLMQLHASKCPDTATIDLHYLRVGEAKESMDLFIDTHIQKLKSNMGRGARQHTLYFITGRGLHSNGRPRVKPAVKKRLRERGLRFNEVNPGLLSAKVCADDRLTHQVA